MDKINGYQLLANAVVEQAANDYRWALCRRDQSKIEDLEKFFRGELMDLYTNVDGEWLIKRLRKEVEGPKVKRVYKTKC